MAEALHNEFAAAAEGAVALLALIRDTAPGAFADGVGSALEKAAQGSTRMRLAWAIEQWNAREVSR